MRTAMLVGILCAIIVAILNGHARTTPAQRFYHRLQAQHLPPWLR